MTPLEELLEELESDLATWGTLSLYEFSWFLRGAKHGLSEDEIATICADAYAEITRRHPLHLEWFDWPLTDLTAGRPAEPGTPLDFDINTTGTIESPFLVLVPDESGSEAEELDA
jgi:hypothetical protein